MDVPILPLGLTSFSGPRRSSRFNIVSSSRGGGGGGGGSSLGSGNGHMCIVIFMSGSIVVSQAEGTIMPESGPIRS